LAYGIPLRFDTRCPRCGSVDRHRQLVLADQKFNLFQGKRVLHFAPEAAVRNFVIGREPSFYVSADLYQEADRKENIEAMTFESSSFDVAIVLHVLEHVDDAKALGELHRVLAPGGRIVLMFPICEGWETTYENPAHTSAQERRLYFGQYDHVRFYGRDVRDRIRAAGFFLDEHTAAEPEVSRYGLMRGDKVFVGTKTE
jgi:SAM-dependent methyltransferase